MTTRIVWLCHHSTQPVCFTADVDRLAPGEYRVHADIHITAHMRQHRG